MHHPAQADQAVQPQGTGHSGGRGRWEVAPACSQHTQEHRTQEDPCTLYPCCQTPCCPTARMRARFSAGGAPRDGPCAVFNCSYWQEGWNSWRGAALSSSSPRGAGWRTWGLTRECSAPGSCLAACTASPHVMTPAPHLLCYGPVCEERMAPLKKHGVGWLVG
jgi:hypothetical protein